MLLLAFGLVAGALTTVAGLGGGQLLVLTLAAACGAKGTLVISAPALLASNLHRAWLFRVDVDRMRARQFAFGAIPGSAVGGLVTVGLPAALVYVLLVTMTALAILRSLGWVRFAPTPRSLGPAGFTVGLVCATTSGAGLLVAPLLMASGLAGRAYVATASLCAAALHSGRLAGYAAGGLVTGATLASSTLLFLGLLLGNVAGERGRRVLPARAVPWLERGTLIACGALAALGASR